MIYRVVLFFVLIFFVSCGSNKGIVNVSKSNQSNSKPVVSTTNRQEPKTTLPTDTESKTNVEIKSEAQLETLEATSKVKVTTELVLQYIEKYKSVAMENMKNHGVPASVSLAQAILESGAGTGKLSVSANNHFGIKCHKDWNGPGVNHDDDALQECFRKYNNVYDSYQDYAAFLRGRKWYDPLFKLDKNDYKGWAYGLKKAGYATDPKYPLKIIGIIERYQLQKFDAMVLGIQNKETNPIEVQTLESKKTQLEYLHTVVKGDTLYSISKRYNISVDDLKKKNRIAENTLSIGQVVEIK